MFWVVRGATVLQHDPKTYSGHKSMKINKINVNAIVQGLDLEHLIFKFEHCILQIQAIKLQTYLVRYIRKKEITYQTISNQVTPSQKTSSSRMQANQLLMTNEVNKSYTYYSSTTLDTTASSKCLVTHIGYLANYSNVATPMSNVSSLTHIHSQI